MDKNLLIMSEMPQHFINLADENFKTYKLWLLTLLLLWVDTK